MLLSKEHKWLLSSHLQKSIRRGWEDEAIWATEELHRIDRAYLAYRLSVIAVEDIGVAGTNALSPWIDTQKKWGAKRFLTEKSDDDLQQWKKVVASFCQSEKDRTACEWMGCTYFIEPFEKKYGQWETVLPDTAIAILEKPINLKWWEMGLLAWRIAGTERFPSAFLPENTKGEWEKWLQTVPEHHRKIIEYFGHQQREAHPVFLPLCSLFYNENSPLISFNCGSIEKNDIWLTAALDKHTREGSQALHHFIQEQLRAYPNKKPNHLSYNDLYELVGKLMFWFEGGWVSQSRPYPISQTITQEIRQHICYKYNVSPQWLLKEWGDKNEWKKSRAKSVSCIKEYKQKSMTL